MISRIQIVGFALLSFVLVSCVSQKALYEPLSITMNKTGCFGTCPIYSLNIQSSGLAVFSGERFTDKLGKWTKDFSQDTSVNSFFKMAAQEDWQVYESYYPTPISDLPGVVLTINFQDSSKEIIIRGEHPAQLDVFVDMLTRFADSKGWENLNLE